MQGKERLAYQDQLGKAGDSEEEKGESRRKSL